MKKAVSDVLAVLIAYLVSPLALANLTPGARYFTGQVNVNMGQPTTCYIETLYSPDLSMLAVRSISTLQHLSPAGQPIWVALGPYTATFFAAKNLYRFQDAAPGATVKDIVINTNGQSNPIKYGVLYWHADAGHHDPIFCENLTESATPSELEAIGRVFANFDSMKP